MTSYDLVPEPWNPGQGTLPPQGRTWITGEKPLELASGGGSLEDLVKLLEPQFSYV